MDCCKLGKLTVVFIAGWLLAWALFHSNFWPLIALMPAAIKLVSHFLFTDNLRASLIKVASSIGFNNIKNAEVKYKREKSRDLLSIPSLYFLLSWGIFTSLMFFYAEYGLALLTSTILGLWILNTCIARFADSQSLYMAIFSVATAAIIITPDELLLIIYWLCVSPLPVLIGAGSGAGNFLWPKSYKPFGIQSLISRAEEFLAMLPKDSRVLLALNDPGREYSKIFDGYRVIYELAFYAGNLRHVLVFPDWWAVFENNTMDSPGFWGRTPTEVLANLKQWDGDHALIYQNSGTDLNPQWSEFGFTELASMDWGLLLDKELDGESCWGEKPAPKWYLLKAPT